VNKNPTEKCTYVSFLNDKRAIQHFCVRGFFFLFPLQIHHPCKHTFHTKAALFQNKHLLLVHFRRPFNVYPRLLSFYFDSFSSQRSFNLADLLTRHNDTLVPTGLSFFQAAWDESVTKTYNDIIGMRNCCVRLTRFVVCDKSFLSKYLNLYFKKNF